MINSTNKIFTSLCGQFQNPAKSLPAGGDHCYGVKGVFTNVLIQKSRCEHLHLKGGVFLGRCVRRGWLLHAEGP